MKITEKQRLEEKRFIYMHAISGLIAKGANDFKIQNAFKALEVVEKQLAEVLINEK